MHRSWLVQRLDPPRTGHLLGKDNPFAFGGGLRNGGLSDEAMGLLRDIFSFDYMGAAEFEFGAIPKTLNQIAGEISNYRTYSFDIPLSEVEKDYQDPATEAPEGEATIYTICNKDHHREVEQRIRAWAEHAYGAHGRRLKEETLLHRVLRPYGEYPPRCVGWLELDNGFFFFTDKVMWEKTCDLFGLDR